MAGCKNPSIPSTRSNELKDSLLFLIAAVGRKFEYFQGSHFFQKSRAARGFRTGRAAVRDPLPDLQLAARWRPELGV